ncbi:chemotaxis response regulator protein-glutamate methylesterase [Ammoniphilus sp. CFH 90114]|uniref:protein-glutamate methylesterase/protein-glutamine glutaminase n=1 Tax=Ammoniphilus sp. CFH 90114 TaxID=2493665 RepID=UPI00100E08F2|nr:chemotaxis response regulator protein-glutamate methylesterase [Ammoniphilus sp. CFH 90114]RXT15133.1 chemotaxis response regulator protein-glutamate methylesterase [Ammoniphilus sp. CFH 90114]
MRKIRVLVVDDSAFMRKVISDILSQDPWIEVIDKARNGLEGIEKVKKLSPDVVTMDVEMPTMNGLEALEHLMKHHPLPVIMLSSLTHEGATETIKALELGAVDFIPKPSGSISLDIHKVEDQIIAKVKAAAGAKLNKHPISSFTPTREKGNEKVRSDLTLIKKRVTPNPDLPNLILIGTSTGGPKALQIVLTSLPAHIPAAVLIVQHMPPGFTKSLSQRLDTLSALHVTEAEDGMDLKVGSVYIAPGDYHMELKRRNTGQFYIGLNQTEPKAGHRPSVDALFESAALLDLPSTYVVVMTGMGSDGTRGLKALKSVSGCKQIIAEDESTCVVFGMPKSAIASGNVDTVLPLSKIGPYLAEVLI